MCLDGSATIMSEGVEGVTLHKMRNNEWETIPDLVRLDVVLDKDQDMYFASAQVSGTRFI